MAIVEIDLVNYVEKSAARVTPGIYRVQVEDVELTKTKKEPARDLIKVYFRIMGGDFDGKTLISNLTVQESTMFNIVGFLQAIGVPTPKRKIKMDFSKFKGKVLDVDVKDNEYNGNTYSNVDRFIEVKRKTKRDLEIEADENAGETSEEVNEVADDFGEEKVENNDNNSTGNVDEDMFSELDEL